MGITLKIYDALSLETLRCLFDTCFRVKVVGRCKIWKVQLEGGCNWSLQYTLATASLQRDKGPATSSIFDPVAGYRHWTYRRLRWC